MTDGTPRTFRLSAHEDFVPWPTEVPPPENEDFLKVYVDHEELEEKASSHKQWFSEITPNVEDELAFVTFTGSGSEDVPEAYANIYSTVSKTESGQYFVIKYRVPTTNPNKMGYFEIYTSTLNSAAVAGDSFTLTPIEDGKWHVAIVDISKSRSKTFLPEEDKYYAQYIRLDIFNGVTSAEVAVDIAYVGIDSDLMAICELNNDFETVDYYEGSSTFKLSTATGMPYVKTYIDPSSGYTESKELYASQLDYVNYVDGVSTKEDIVTFQTSSKSGIIEVYNYKTLDDKTMNIKGWCAAQGGITKHIWSADGGKTWNDCVGTPIAASEGIIAVVEKRLEITLSSGSDKNGSFQGSPLVIDLSDYAGKTVDVIIGAIPESDETGKSIMLMYCFSDVIVTQ